jgi:hypothetical protein
MLKVINYAKCHYSELMLNVIIISAINQCIYTECIYAECIYAECHDAECRGAHFYRHKHSFPWRLKLNILEFGKVVQFFFFI